MSDRARGPAPAPPPAEAPPALRAFWSRAHVAGGCNFCRRRTLDADGRIPDYPVLVVSSDDRPGGALSPRFCAECVLDFWRAATRGGSGDPAAVAAAKARRKGARR